MHWMMTPYLGKMGHLAAKTKAQAPQGSMGLPMVIMMLMLLELLCSGSTHQHR
jgi:hypothetical protein